MAKRHWALPSSHLEENWNHQPVTMRSPHGALKSEAGLSQPFPAFWFFSPGSPWGTRPCCEAGFDQSTHKPELKPQLPALLKCLITFQDSSLPKTLKGLLFLFTLPFNGRRRGAVDGFDFPHRVHNHNRHVGNFHVLETSLQYNKCPHYRVCRP